MFKKLSKKDTTTLRKWPNDFKIICKYLLYFLPATELPTKGLYFIKERESLDISCASDNIKMWVFFTEEQRRYLQSKKLVFAAPFGTGKTLLMRAESIAQAMNDKKVLYLLFFSPIRHEAITQKGLLYHELSHFFNVHQNIRVMQVTFGEKGVEEILKIAGGYDCIMLDEFFCDLNNVYECSDENWFKDFNALLNDPRKVIWIALSNYFSIIEKR